MSDAWRYHLLASARPVTASWPPEARAEFHDQVMAAPESWRPDGDNAAELAAGARALARAWFPAWRVAASTRASAPPRPGPPPLRPVPTTPPVADLPPLSPADADELARLWMLLGRELALRAWRG